MWTSPLGLQHPPSSPPHLLQQVSQLGHERAVLAVLAIAAAALQELREVVLDYGVGDKATHLQGGRNYQRGQQLRGFPSIRFLQSTVWGAPTLAIGPNAKSALPPRNSFL